jgi:tetratricopeptide (TPR) repeat protein
MNRLILTACITMAWIGLGCEGMDAFRQNPTRARTCCRTGQTLAERGNLEGALDQFHKAIKADPTCTEAYRLRGDVYRKQKQWRLARESYERACGLDPYDFRSHYNLGVTYQRLARLRPAEKDNLIRQAVAVYIRSVAIRSESFDAHLNLGACYYEMGPYELALQHTDIARRLEPANPRANNNFAILSSRLGRMSQAIAAYQASLEARPNQPDVRIQLGKLYLRSKRMISAVSTFRQAARRSPNSAEPWEMLGVCYYRLGQADDAVRAFQEAIRRDPENVAAYRGFGVVCMSRYIQDPTREDLREKALRAWEFALQVDPNQGELERMIQRYAGERPAVAESPSRATPRSQPRSQPADSDNLRAAPSSYRPAPRRYREPPRLSKVLAMYSMR